MSNRLAAVRAERGWKKARLLVELRAAAERRRETLPKDESVGRRVAAWENDGAPVSDFYCELLCDAYGMSAVELGIVELPVAPPRAVPTSDLTFSRLDLAIVDLLRDQTQSLRLLDRRIGGLAVYQQTVAHVASIEQLVRFAFPGTARDAAASELSQAAALAGWQALDAGLLEDAWKHHETATAASRESDDIDGLAYARAQQAYVLIDAGQPAEAHRLIASARDRAGVSIPRELRAWLFAAEGEALAVLGDRDGTLRALDQASAVLPTTPEDALRYLMLNSGHLGRWRGHCLARLGEESAVTELSSALTSMGEGHYGRAEVGLRVDLALALHARNEVEESRAEASKALNLAGQTGSQRQRRRMEGLLSA